jgi:hypothetical protein
MSDLKPNLSFNYLYRDGGNFKQFGKKLFTNPNHLQIEIIEKTIRKNLIDETFFYADKFNVRSLFFDCLNIDDPTWHEFEDLLQTDELPDTDCTIEEFLVAIQHNREGF